jgi:hypothetical protein
MATPINSPVTITPLLKNGSRETRLLTVSQARANISGGMGKNCVSDIFMLFLIRYHAGRIKNNIEPIISWFSSQQGEGQPENKPILLLRYWKTSPSAKHQVISHKTRSV